MSAEAAALIRVVETVHTGAGVETVIHEMDEMRAGIEECILRTAMSGREDLMIDPEGEVDMTISVLRMTDGHGGVMM